ncbi:MAG: SLC13/DASS family transporter, partial [Pseudomonadota bacterium]
MTLAIVAMIILVTEFASNVATASGIIPVVASLAAALGLGEDAVLPEAPREAGAFFTGGVAWLAGGIAIAALFYAIREGVIPGA